MSGINSLRHAGDAMYRALRVAQCYCEFNVPYPGCKVERKVTTQCGRCKSMAAWEALVDIGKTLDTDALMVEPPLAVG